jgi:uncharacterized protein YndB with AHSA1/START domain
MSRVKIEVEYIMKASPTIVYTFLTTPAALVRWFCDEIDIEGDIYTFTWQGYDQQARLVVDIEDEFLKFQWVDGDHEDEYLEYKISTSPITNETILTINDFCDDDEVESQKALWESQVKTMRAEMGG